MLVSRSAVFDMLPVHSASQRVGAPSTQEMMTMSTTTTTVKMVKVTIEVPEDRQLSPEQVQRIFNAGLYGRDFRKRSQKERNEALKIARQLQKEGKLPGFPVKTAAK